MNNKYQNFDTATTLAAGAIFAALVAVSTYLFVIPIPATSGYFNLGETIIYVAALTLGPFVGTFAGAGAAIADVMIPGGAVFAPGTFIIKALEGFTVGFLNRKLMQKNLSLTVSAMISVVAGGLIMIVGYFTYEIRSVGFSSWHRTLRSAVQRCADACGYSRCRPDNTRNLSYFPTT